MSAIVFNSPLAYTVVHDRIFRAMNLFEFRSSSPFLEKCHGPFLYMMRTSFCYFGCTLQFLSLFTASSVLELSTVLFVASNWINVSIKDMRFMVKKREIIELWQQLDDDDFKARTSGELECVKSAYNSIRVINALGVFSFVPSSSSAIVPYFLRQLPFMFWTPFDPFRNFSTYMALYLHESLCGVFTGMIFIVNNWYILLVMICLDYNYALLGERAAHIGHQTTNKLETYGRMIELIKLHMKINRLFNMVNEIFNEVFLLQILQAAVAFANCAFLILMVDSDVADIIPPLMFFVLFGSEMYLLCYFSTKITSTYDTISDKANFAEVLQNGDMKTAKALALHINVVDSRPMKVETVSIVRYELSLQMFMAIVKTTYSIVMLLADK